VIYCNFRVNALMKKKLNCNVLKISTITNFFDLILPFLALSLSEKPFFLILGIFSSSSIKHIKAHTNIFKLFNFHFMDYFDL